MQLSIWEYILYAHSYMYLVKCFFISPLKNLPMNILLLNVNVHIFMQNDTNVLIKYH